MFPHNDGSSKPLTPLSTATGAGKVDVAQLRLEFGSFVHIFNDNLPTNTMNQRTTGAIALNSVENAKGEYYSLNLKNLKTHLKTPVDSPPYAPFRHPAGPLPCT